MSEMHADPDANNSVDNDTLVAEPLSSNSAVNHTTVVNGPTVTSNLTILNVNSLSPASSTPRSPLSGTTTPDTASVSDSQSFWSSGASNRSEWGAKSVDPAMGLPAAAARAPPFIPREVPWSINAHILINPCDEVVLGRDMWPAPVFRVQIPPTGFPRGTAPAVSVFIGNERRLLSPRLVSGTDPAPLVKVGVLNDGCLYYKFDKLKIEGTVPEESFQIRFMFYLQRTVGPPVGEVRSLVQTSIPFRILQTESGRPTPMLTTGQQAIYRSLERPWARPYGA